MTSSVDTGPLDWRIAITDKSGRPTPEFQRRWNTQRNNNALIGIIQFGTGVPTGTPEDGAEYVDTTRVPGILYIGKGGHWILAGVQSFTDLKDAPANYTSAAGKIVRVNPGGTALIFDTVTSVLDSLGAARGDILYRGTSGWTVLAPGTAGNVLSTNGAGADPSWIAAGGGGGGGPQHYGMAPAGFDPRNSNASGTGFFVGRVIVMPKATTLNNLILPVFSSVPTCVVTPAIYGVTAGTYDIAALLKSGPAVTGIVKGLQTLPLTSGLAVTEGQVLWVGVTISGAAISVAVCSATGSVFFTSPAIPPNPAAAPTYNGTTACVWVAE